MAWSNISIFKDPTLHNVNKFSKMHNVNKSMYYLTLIYLVCIYVLQLGSRENEIL